MMKNSEIMSLSRIGERLKDAGSVLIFPHGSIDGDALGSSASLCLALRSMGKESYVMMDEDIPDNIEFLENNCCSWDLDIISDPDVCVCIDNGELARIFDRQELFHKGKSTMLIDHHKSSEPFLDYNYIDVNASASAEIIYDLILEMGVSVDSRMAEAIYSGIVTDTGRFQYSNTTRRTHEIVAQLMDCGIDQNKISVQIYQNVSPEKIKLQSSIMNTLKLEDDGKVALAYMTKDMLEETGAKDQETEGIVEKLRNLKGVEVAVFVKEKDPEGIKVSMRSKFDFDVAEISQQFGGGGHMKAAGFSSNEELPVVIKQALQAIGEKLK